MMEGFLRGRHLISLGVFFLTGTVLLVFLRKRSIRCRRVVLGVLSFAGLPAIIWYPAAFGDLLRFLPLELCSYTALLLPVAVWTGNRRLNNILLLWAVGAFSAILLNPAETAWRPGETEFWMFFVPHAAEAAIPPLVFALGLSEKDVRCIPITLGATLGAGAFSHACNLMINRFFAEAGSSLCVNYMFAEWPENPVLDVCWRILPVRFAYLLVLAPAVLVLLTLLYLPEFAARIRKNR